MLRLAIPNKGVLSGAAAQMLREAGYRQRADDNDLTCLDVDNDVEFFYLRPRDIATYVASGDLDLGITGRDMVVDAGVAVDEVLDLGFGASAFRFAARPGRYASVADLAEARIATSYPGVVTQFLDAHGIKADVIRLEGAVENAIGLGLADVVADVVDTGATLRKAGLVALGEVVLRSAGVLVRGHRAGESDLSSVGDTVGRGPAGTGPAGTGPGGSGTVGSGAITQLVRRLQGVLVARRYVMLAYDVRADQLDDAAALTPGIESPTISPLHREGWVAVQAMVLRSDIHKIMDELYEIGARAILVTDIHACRL